MTPLSLDEIARRQEAREAKNFPHNRRVDCIECESHLSALLETAREMQRAARDFDGTVEETCSCASGVVCWGHFWWAQSTLRALLARTPVDDALTPREGG